jgi:hypothetical protein
MTSVDQLIGPDDANGAPSAYEWALENPSGKVCAPQHPHRTDTIAPWTQENP